MKFKSRMKVGSTIFTGTMADIVFLLLVFFMATTLFKEEGGLRVRFPQAHPQVMSELGKQFLTVTVWIKQSDPGNDNSELIARIGDYDMPVDQVADQLSRLSNKFWREQNQKLDVVVLNVDTRVPMEDIVGLFNDMRFEEIYSIQFNAEDLGLYN
jgi:biopolymer transport protein ExbD